MNALRHFFATLSISCAVLAIMPQDALSAQKARGEFAPLATPEGIMIQPLGIAQGYGLTKETATKLPRQQIVYADANGMTLYTFDGDKPGKSLCVDECEKMWPPAIAPTKPRLVSGWSVIVRPDGRRQWALNEKPLYSFSGDEDIGSVGGNSPARFGRGPGVGRRSSCCAPTVAKDKPMPAEWHAAMMYPVNDLEVPGGFVIREVEDAMAVVLVDETTGKTLYAFDGDPTEAMKACASDACRSRWSPAIAPRIAFDLGEFSSRVREDGISQWTYKGRALFTYAGDQIFGDAYGMGVDKRWQVAAVVRYFVPPGVGTQITAKLGKVLATAEGQTLYRRNGYIWQSGGGHGVRRGDPIRPAVGRDIGIDPRCTVECEKWHPFLAPQDAQSQGDWSVADRPDGTKQWVHRGYALWTFDGDKQPGDINANGSYQIKMSHDDKTIVDIGTPTDGVWALLWIAAYP